MYPAPKKQMSTGAIVAIVLSILAITFVLCGLLIGAIVLITFITGA